MQKIKELKPILVPRLGPRTSCPRALAMHQMCFNIFEFSLLLEPHKVSSFQVKIFENHQNFKNNLCNQEKKERFLYNTKVYFQRQLLRNPISTFNLWIIRYPQFPLFKNTKNHYDIFGKYVQFLVLIFRRILL